MEKWSREVPKSLFIGGSERLVNLQFASYTGYRQKSELILVDAVSFTASHV